MSAWRPQTLGEQIKQTRREQRNQGVKDFFGQFVLGAAVAFAVLGCVFLVAYYFSK